MITRDDVVHAAKLSRLRLKDAEVDAIASDLERIVVYVEQLMKVDVEGVEPMLHAIAVSSPEGVARRPDDATSVIGPRALEGSAGFEDGLVRVPKVVD